MNRDSVLVSAGESNPETSLLEGVWWTLRAAMPALPQRDDLVQEEKDAQAAQERGYYLPDEDERLREVYSRYLSVRVSLWESVAELRPLFEGRKELDWESRMQAFGMGFCAAAMLVRSASFVVGLAEDRPIGRVGCGVIMKHGGFMSFIAMRSSPVCVRVE